MISTSPSHRANPTAHYRWVVLAMIVIASFIAYLLRTNLSFIGPTLMSDLGLTELQLGMVFAAFNASYAIFQFPSGIFGGRVGSRTSITAIALAWGVLTVATGLVPDSNGMSIGVVVACLIAVRFLMGVVQAPIFPVTGGTTADWFPVGHWGLPLGLASTGLTLGGAATGPIIVWLVELCGWRGALFVTAPAAFLLAAAWWWYVRDYPKDHPKVSAEERALIDANRPPPRAHAEHRGAWKTVLRNRDILLLTISYFCMNFVFYFFFNWFFVFLVNVKGFAGVHAGGLTAAQWVIGAIGATLGGFGCDRLIASFGRRRGPQLLSIGGLLLCAVLLFTGATASHPLVAVGLLCAAFGATQITEAAYWATMCSVAGRFASEAGGVLNTGGNAVGFIGALLVPLVAERFGWVPAVGMGSVFAVIAAVLWLFIRGDRSLEAVDE